jgi:hypothetical protein
MGEVYRWNAVLGDDLYCRFFSYSAYSYNARSFTYVWGNFCQIFGAPLCNEDVLCCGAESPENLGYIPQHWVHPKEHWVHPKSIRCTQNLSGHPRTMGPSQIVGHIQKIMGPITEQSRSESRTPCPFIKPDQVARFCILCSHRLIIR